jgi:hypothetical protein
VPAIDARTWLGLNWKAIGRREEKKKLGAPWACRRSSFSVHVSRCQIHPCWASNPLVPSCPRLPSCLGLSSKLNPQSSLPLASLASVGLLALLAIDAPAGRTASVFSSSVRPLFLDEIDTPPLSKYLRIAPPSTSLGGLFWRPSTTNNNNTAHPLGSDRPTTTWRDSCASASSTSLRPLRGHRSQANRAASDRQQRTPSTLLLPNARHYQQPAPEAALSNSALGRVQWQAHFRAVATDTPCDCCAELIGTYNETQAPVTSIFSLSQRRFDLPCSNSFLPIGLEDHVFFFFITLCLACLFEPSYRRMPTDRPQISHVSQHRKTTLSIFTEAPRRLPTDASVLISSSAGQPCLSL